MRVLGNTGLVLFLAVFFGLFLPGFSNDTSGFITLYLIVAMTLSLREMSLSRKDVKQNIRPSLRAAVINYGLLSATIIISAYFLVPDRTYFAGFVIMAAVPPAIAVVPFTFLLKGDVKASLAGEVLCYLLALLLAPLMTFLILGSAVNFFEITRLLLILIIVPMAVSFPLKKIPDRFFAQNRPVINISLALITYSIIGLNQGVIFSNFIFLLPLLAVLFIKSFVTGFGVYFGSLARGTKKERAVSYSLFASHKNGGMTAAFAIALLGPVAALPAALEGIFEFAYIIIFQHIVGMK